MENENNGKETAIEMKPRNFPVFNMHNTCKISPGVKKTEENKASEKPGLKMEKHPAVKGNPAVDVSGNTATSAAGESSAYGMVNTAKAGTAGADIGAATSVKTATGAAESIRRACENLGKSVKRAGAGAAGLILFIIFFGITAVILFSAFGAFFAEISGDMTLASVAEETRSAYLSEIQAACEQYMDGNYDSVNVIYEGSADGDSPCINNINDVTGVYAVYVTMNSDNPSDAVTMNSEKAEIFRNVFYSMNSYSVYCSDMPVTEMPDDGTEVVMIQRSIYVSLSSLDYLSGAQLLGFSDEMNVMMKEIMNPEYSMCFTQILSSEMYTDADLTHIVSGLPAGSKGSVTVRAALSKLGCPYEWGAKGEYSFDCSGLVYWAVSQADRAAGYELYTNAAGQASFCRRRGRAVGYDELMPGDLVFWKKTSCGGCGRWNEIHHTGIYAGDGMVIEASSSRGCVVLRPLWEGPDYELFMFARPC